MIGKTNVGGGAGGAGGGATLVISSPANVSVTVSKDDKSYTKNSGSLGSTTFKGLATGTWTVTISGNGQTATRTIEITADYAITIAFFSATINITYPANSTCVVTNSSGQTVASDINATSSEKTFTATVNATGTYTVTATATGGSGNTKSESVEITSEGQSESVVLNYQLVLFDNGIVNNITWDAIQQPTFAISNVSSVIEVGGTGYDDGISAIYPMGWRGTTNAINLSTYETLKVTVLNTSGTGSLKVGIGSTATQNDVLSGDISSVAESTTTFDISALNDSYFISIYAGPSTLGTFSAKISKVWLE